MDGFDMPGSTNGADSMLLLASKLGAVEQALRTVVTHEKLISILNEQRKEIIGSVRDSEVHLKSVVETQSVLNDKRHTDLQSAQDRRINELFTSLDRMMADKVGGAVETAFKARDAAEAKARLEIENKAKDAVRGFRLVMAGKNAIIGGVLVVLALFVVKMTFGWSPFG